MLNFGGAGSKKAAESHRGGAFGRAGGQASLLSDDEGEGRRPSGGYAPMGRGGAAYDSSNSLRSQDRASDGGMGGAASTSGFSGFEDATEGKAALPRISFMHMIMHMFCACIPCICFLHVFHAYVA